MAAFSENQGGYLLNYDSQACFKTIYVWVFLIDSGLILFVMSSEFLLTVRFPAGRRHLVLFGAAQSWQA